MKIIKPLVQYLWEGSAWSPSGSPFCIGGGTLGTGNKIWIGSPFQSGSSTGGAGKGGNAGACYSGALCKGAEAGGGLQEQSIVTEL